MYLKIMARENAAPIVWSLSSVLRLGEREKRKTLVTSLPMQARIFSRSYSFTCCNAGTLVFVAMCTTAKKASEKQKTRVISDKKNIFPQFFFWKGENISSAWLVHTSAGEFRNSISQDRRRKQRERGESYISLFPSLMHFEKRSAFLLEIGQEQILFKDRGTDQFVKFGG